uniref:Putative ribonuclease H-like domain-containing protein n=1 Tax=Tanacetum cinerariifolium TaxID=118510 RepID=A0A6L2JAV4_TANCI|nr:putative ribonuclease H-like domain-containing protein [Tanacetum cinerariifolium]
MILESVQNGPLIWPAIEENGLTRPRKYSELTHAEAIQVDCDVKSVEIDRLKQTLFEQLREKESLMQTVTLLKNDFKKEESKNIDREIALEKKIKHKAQQLEPKLYDGNVIKSTSAFVIPDFEETLMLAEESCSGSNGFRKENPSPFCRPIKVKVPKEHPKVSMVNTSLKKLKHHLAGFDVVVKERTMATAITKGLWWFEHTKACFRDEIIPFVKALKDIFNTFDKYLIDELTKIQNVFHQMKQAVDQHCLESKKFKFKMNQVLNENERLLEQVINKDIVNIVVNYSVDSASVNMHECKKCLKLKTELLNIKDFIGKETYDKMENSVSNQSAPCFDQYFELNKLKAQSQEKDMVIRKLKERIKSLSGNMNKDKEKDLVITTPKDELRKHKGKDLADNIVTKHTIAQKMLKVDVEPIAPKLLNNRTTHSDYLRHTQEQAMIIREVVEQGKSQNPLNNSLDSSCKYTKRIQELLIIIRQTCPSINNSSDKLVAVTPKNKGKRVRFTDPITSSGTTNTQTYSSSNLVSNKPALPSAGLKPSTSASGSQPSGNTKKDSIQRPPSSTQKNKVESHPRTVRSSLKNKNCVFEPKGTIIEQHSKLNANFEFICVKCNGCMLSDNHDLPTGQTFTIVGNACPLTRIITPNEVPPRKPTILETDTPKPVVTLVYSRKPRKSKTNVHVSKPKIIKSISANNKEPNMMASSPICLLLKASKTKSWLWHRRLSHQNFGAINHLARHGLGRGLPKLKFNKDHLCYVCAMGKSKKKPQKPKFEDTNQEKLYLLHMDLCGPMRVASVNGKKYILVIVDDNSRFTWVKCLRSKEEAPDFIIKFLKMIQLQLKAPVRRIRTDNKTEFINQTLREYYKKVGISHETSVARSLQQNGVVERRNRMLIEVARTILEPALHEMTPAIISLRLVPNPPPSTPLVPPTKTDWDLLFQPMFDKLLNPPPTVDLPALKVIAPIAKVVAPETAASIGSPSSTTVDQDAPSPNVAHMETDPFFSIPIPENDFESSSSDAIPTVVHTAAPNSEHKLDELGGILKNKARLVARGYRQEEGLILSQPDGFVDQDNPNHVYKLKKDLYVLKQAPRTWGIWYPKDSSIALTAYADADHVGCQDTRRSTSRSMQLLGERHVSWSSKRQKSVTLHFIKEQVENEVVELYFVNTEYQLANIFTKAFCRERIEFLINKLGMQSFTPETLKQLADEAEE